MKRIRKMDERELMMQLKVCRVCYIVLSLVIFICFSLQFFNVFEGKEGIYLPIIMLVDSVTFAIATIIYNPDKKCKNEK